LLYNKILKKCWQQSFKLKADKVTKKSEYEAQLILIKLRNYIYVKDVDKR